MIKYHLGSGRKYMKGYINVDFPQEKHNVIKVRADRYEDILKMDYGKCKVDEIRSHHVFEHFNYVESFILLIRWTTALKDESGVLIIDVPDISQIVHGLNNFDSTAQQEFAIMRLIYGDQGSDWAYHRNGWTAFLLTSVLRAFGYATTKKSYGKPSNKFPNCGVKVRGEKRRIYHKQQLIAMAKSFLSFYLKLPNEKKLYGLYCERLDNA